MTPKHPLLIELRRARLLWHCTSVQVLWQIVADGEITPNNGRIAKWGTRPSACQALGGVSLFDFTTPTEAQVLKSSIHWRPFLYGAPPVTVVIGLERRRLSGRLIPYPENRDATSLDRTGAEILGPIPHVETCHCGSISVLAIQRVLLVSVHDFRICERFYPEGVFREMEELARFARK